MTAKITLDGKVAIVTGASRGIGEAIARTFAAHGAKVVLAARKMEGLEAVAKSINDAHPGSAVAVTAHTGKESDCAALVAAAKDKLGKVDVLVNNAATNPYFGTFMDVDMGAWDKTFEVNVKGYFWMTREVVKHLRERNAPGSIVHVASVAGLIASPLQGVYGMTKAAILSMTKTLSFELAGSNIRVNAIAPGFVDTRFAAAIVKNDALVSKVLERTPMARVAPKFFYDALGSHLFDAITRLDEYYPTRTEAAIFDAHLDEIAECVGRGCTLIDLGAGDGRKAARLFGKLAPSEYAAIDISAEYLRSAVESLQRQYPRIRMLGVGTDFSFG